MARIDYSRLLDVIVKTVCGAVLVGALTVVSFRLHLNFAIPGFLYLVVVVLQSLTGSFASSAFISLVSVACLDYFFVPPILSFQVTNPLDAVALLSFLVTGLVITRLTTQVRKEATVTVYQRQQMNRLYELASQLLALNPADALLTKSVERFCQTFHLHAICLYDASQGDIHCSGNVQRRLTETTVAAYRSRQDCDSRSGSVFRCLWAAGQTIGAVGFDGLTGTELTAGPLAALAAAMLERHRVFQSASHSAASAQAEVYRAAVLDALAHEFKTPLATIVTAAGCLREIVAESKAHQELAEVIEAESSRLSTLTSRVLRTSKLNGDEVTPRLEPTDVSDLVTKIVDQYSREWTDRKIRVLKQEGSADVFADTELLQIAVRQLIENACKYSPPGSPVNVSIERECEHAAVRIRNFGVRINAKERDRIFDRFYRGAESLDFSTGSGLGLYFARKILRAHGGSVDLEDETHGREAETVFRVSIPLAKTPC
jgi:two-component system, OmpR family, sensor histidine kinase KdpD